MTSNAINTKEKLLNIAHDLIQRNGVNGMSFQDLSNEVGIRKASVHHHFANKAEMIKALAERQLKDFDGKLNSIQNSKINGKSKLKRYCDLFVTTLKSGDQERSCLFGMLMAEFKSVDEEARGHICSFMENNIRFLESILDEGVKDGSLNQINNVKSIANLILSTVEGGLFVSRCSGGPKQLADTTKHLIQLLSN